MRFLFIPSLLLILCACAAPGRNEASAQNEEVAAAAVAWRTAYDSRDPARIASQYAPEAVFWGTTAKTVAATPAAIFEYFKDAPNRPNARVTFGEQHIRTYGDVAAITGHYTFTDTRDGKDISNPSRFSLAFQRQGGKWLIVQHHSSRLPQ